MSSLRDEELILYYYGELPDETGIEEQLESSPEMRQRYAALCVVLDSVAEPPIPEPHPAYGSRVWHRIAPEIGASSGHSWGWDWLRPRRSAKSASDMSKGSGPHPRDSRKGSTSVVGTSLNRPNLR